MASILLLTYVVENRQYNQDSTLEEVEMIKSRVRLIEPGIVLYTEVPKMSIFSTELLFDKLDELIENEEVEGILFDLSPAKAPDIKIRQLLAKRFLSVTPRVKYYSFSTGKNGLINIAMKFFMNTNKAESEKSIYSKDLATAKKKLYEKLGR